MARFDRSALSIVDFASHLHPSDPDNKDHEYIDEELGEPVYLDPEAHLRANHAAGVDGAVLSQPVFMGHPDLEATREANDAMLEVVESYDEYHGLAAIPTGAGVEAAAGEFERCLDAGFNGGGLETLSPDGLEVHHDEMAPILEIADRTGAPILVHPKLHGSLNSDVLDDSWLLNASLGRDAGLAASIVKVVHTGVFDRYPNLKLVFHHTGGNVASMMGRVQNMLVMFRPEEWAELKGEPLDAQVKDFPAFERQLQERVYVDTAGHYGYHSVLRSALMQFPTSQLLFGTDFPFEVRSQADFADYISVIEREVGSEDAERILSGNVLDLLVNTG